MNKLITMISILVFSAFATLTAESSHEVTGKNEFGGSTFETQYVKGDKFYNDLGIVKSIVHYDPDNNVRFVEYYYAETYASQKNFNKKIEYYNDKQRVVERGIFLYG